MVGEEENTYVILLGIVVITQDLFFTVIFSIRPDFNIFQHPDFWLHSPTTYAVVEFITKGKSAQLIVQAFISGRLPLYLLG